MAVRRNYRINLRNYGNPPAIMVSQYDENYDLVFEVYDGVVPATGLNAYTVKLVGRQPGEDPALKYEFTGTVSGIANNILSFTIDTTMTGRAGKGTAEIVILDTTNDVKFASFNLPVYVEKAAVPDDAIDADTERAQEIAEEIQEIVDTAAAEVKGEAEAWAVGQRDGVDVPSTDPAYENNAKFYAEQAAQIAEDISGVTGQVAQNTSDISDLKEDLNAVIDDVIETETVELETVELDGYYKNLNWYDDNLRSTKKADVSGLDRVRVVVNTGQNYNIYTFTDASNTILTYLLADTSNVNIDAYYDVPANAKYVYVSTNTKAKGENIKIYKDLTVSKIDKIEDDIADLQSTVRAKMAGRIALVKSDHTYQVRTVFEGSDKYMAINFTDNGSQNGGFNFANYSLLDTLPEDDAEIAVGTQYKGALDDICPIRYNGSYRGANHGRSQSFTIMATSHGLTESDIGSVWKGANNKNYVIVRINDENSFLVIGDTDSSKYDIVISVPTTPFTHVSGATHTSSIAFSSAVDTQLIPTFKNYVQSISDENGNIISQNGVFYGNKYFQIDESYELFDIADMVAKLKQNVGSNTNNSYYSDTIDSNLLIQNSYRIYTNGSCVVACNAVPLKAGVYVEYWGGVQAGKIGDDIYAPFTSYDTIQTQGETTIQLTSATWDNVNFPAYKMYQFSANNGFAVGYCIDYGQGLPNVRKDVLQGANSAGFWNGSTHKMYPHFYDYSLADAPDLYGSALSFYAFRVPVIKDSNSAIVWYKIGDATYIEIELFAQTAKMIKLPVWCGGKNITVVKKSDTISIPVDVASATGVYVSGVGSVTLKI